MELIIYYFNKIKTYLIVLVVIATLFCLSIWLFNNSEYLKVDRCLDSGGRFDYEIKKCEY